MGTGLMGIWMAQGPKIHKMAVMTAVTAISFTVNHDLFTDDTSPVFMPSSNMLLY